MAGAGRATYVFKSPPVLLTGGGCSAEVGRLAAGMGIRRALVVVDPGVSASGGRRRCSPRARRPGWRWPPTAG